jgi:hypothetical protein
MLVGGQRHATAVVPLEKGTGTKFTGGLWVGPRLLWTGEDHLASIFFRTSDRSARSESLYRLRYPAQRLWLILNPVTGTLCRICSIRFSYLCGVDLNSLQLTSVSFLEHFPVWYMISLRALRSSYLNIMHIQNFF